MQSWKQYFKGKKVTVLGLGLLGKGLGDTIFLAECGAEVTVTDLKSEKELASSVEPLRKYSNVHLKLGGHDLKDFEDCDFVLKAQGIPLDSPYIAHARKRNIPIRMDDELFISLAPKITTVGVTGTRGKTTTATLLYTILKKAKKRVHLAGNIRGVATLALLPKIKEGDIVVLELSSWQLQGFGESKISPNIAVFTNFMPDHMNYYKESMKDYFDDKAQIFKYQGPKDVLIAGEKVSKKVSKSYKGKLIVPQTDYILKNWDVPVPGEHNRINTAFAVEAAKILKIPLPTIKKGVESFKAVTGRLQYAKTVKGIKIYNDNSSSTPEATLVALQSLSASKIVLIMGGSDKGLSMSPLFRKIPMFCKHIVMLPGSGTDKLRSLPAGRGSGNYSMKSSDAESLEDALTQALAHAEKGDVILFSPAFASFGAYTNVYDRGDQFIELLKKLK